MAITVETGFPNTNIPGILRNLRREKKLTESVEKIL